MPSLNYQARWAEDVESGAKSQTFGKCRTHPIIVGHMLYHYNESQINAGRWLRTDVCTRVVPGTITGYGDLVLDGIAQTEHESERFAQLEGFESYDEMWAWFYETYGLPFVGDVIHWDPEA